MKRMAPFIFIAFGIVSIIVGLILMYQKHSVSQDLAKEGSVETVTEATVNPDTTSLTREVKESKTGNGDENHSSKNNIIRENNPSPSAATVSQPPQTSSAKTDEDLAKEKGMAFEKFVVGKLDIKHYRLLEWQGDKYNEGRYAESSLNPDLVVALRNRNLKFAVECKWRSRFVNDRVLWATNGQLERYHQYMSTTSLPVFIVIGIGGEPAQPEELYIVPLSRMKYSSARRDYLQPYKRVDVSRSFFYDLTDNLLK
jgi:hypothetical protein